MTLLLALACSTGDPWFVGRWDLSEQTLAGEEVQGSAELQLTAEEFIWDGAQSTNVASAVTSTEATLRVTAANGLSFTTHASLDADQLVLSQGENMTHRFERNQ